MGRSKKKHKRNRYKQPAGFIHLRTTKPEEIQKCADETLGATYITASSMHKKREKRDERE